MCTLDCNVSEQIYSSGNVLHFITQVNYWGYHLHRIHQGVSGPRTPTLVYCMNLPWWWNNLSTFPRTKVENFSLQLLHCPVRFGVIGFFNLDFMLLKSVNIFGQGILTTSSAMVIFEWRSTMKMLINRFETFETEYILFTSIVVVLRDHPRIR